MKLLIVHLSDIHIKAADDVILGRDQDIAAAVFSEMANADHVAIVLTGDIAFSGKKSQYELAKVFFTAIKQHLTSEKMIPVDFVTTPGNHDCDFQKDSVVRRHLLSRMLISATPEIDESVIDICTSIQTAYFEFRAVLEGATNSSGDALWRTREIRLGDKCVHFDSVNMAWLSQLHEEPGQLFFPVNRYEKPDVEISADIRLLITHQPFNWLNAHSYRPLRKFLRGVASMVFNGHEHIPNSGFTDEQESGQSAFVEGGVLQADSRSMEGSSFNLVTIDLATQQYSTRRFMWNGSRYSKETDEAWSAYRALPIKRGKSLPIHPDFLKYLDDPGGPITHPDKERLSLGELFVYPDLRRIDEVDQKTFNISASILRESINIEGGVVISGEEKSGRSTLLRHLFREYHDNCLVPLLLTGDAIRRVDETAIESAIESAVIKQYGKSKAEEYIQLPKRMKVILIDDFDSTPIRASASRQIIVSNILLRAIGVILIVDEYTNIRELTSPAAELATLLHYQLQPFGYLLRSKLISKWYAIGEHATEDEYTLAEKRNHAETLMNAVMTKHLVPSSPLYLLTILQSVGAGHASDFKEGALGYYYQYLITRSLQKAGVKPGKLTEYFQYCTHLAWAMHQQSDHELSDSMLDEFNQRFSEQWQRVELKIQLEVLTKAGIILTDASGSRFRYSYIYYYFKGLYLSQSLGDLDTQAYVKRCCDHLYVRDNAYTILFLAHHTNDDFVLRSIGEALQKTFRHRAPTELDKDTMGISNLISDSPKLIYRGGKPAEHRERRDRLKDAMESSDDGLFPKEVERPGDDLTTQITAMFKTIEILGHVLKNQYAKITRSKKAEMLDEIFDGPLRALSDFYSFLENNPNSLFQMIERAIEKTGRNFDEDAKKQFSRKLASTLILAVSVNFLMRAASSASAKELMEDVEKVVKKRNTISRRLIELAIALDGPSPLPRKKLQTLKRDIGNHLIAARSLHFIVINRLYMFPIKETDMQWLANEMGLDLEWQHSVTYRAGANSKLT